MLNALSQLMDGGYIELLTRDGKALAVLKISDPAAMTAMEGELVLNSIEEEDAALADGTAKAARIIGSNGAEVFSCDVGDEKSDAVIKLNTTKIFRGGPVRLKSFRLVMP